jgi:hypothetical protein
VIDTVHQLRVTTVYPPAIAHQDFVDLLLVQERLQSALGFLVDGHALLFQLLGIFAELHGQFASIK